MFENSFIIVFSKAEKQYAVKFSYDLEGNAFDGCKAFKYMSENEANDRKEEGVRPTIADFSYHGYYQVFRKIDGDDDYARMITLEEYDQNSKRYFFVTRNEATALGHPVTNGSEFRCTFLSNH